MQSQKAIPPEFCPDGMMMVMDNVSLNKAVFYPYREPGIFVPCGSWV
jgi:hypothetical protein